MLKSVAVVATSVAQLPALVAPSSVGCGMLADNFTFCEAAQACTLPAGCTQECDAADGGAARVFCPASGGTCQLADQPCADHCLVDGVHRQSGAAAACGGLGWLTFREDVFELGPSGWLATGGAIAAAPCGDRGPILLASPPPSAVHKRYSFQGLPHEQLLLSMDVVVAAWDDGFRAVVELDGAVVWNSSESGGAWIVAAGNTAASSLELSCRQASGMGEPNFVLPVALVAAHSADSALISLSVEGPPGVGFQRFGLDSVRLALPARHYIAEAGIALVNGSNFTAVELGRYYHRPAILISVPTDLPGGEAIVARVQHGTSPEGLVGSFSLLLQDCSSQGVGGENVTGTVNASGMVRWLVVETGMHRTAEGTPLLAGTMLLAGGRTVALDVSGPFSSPGSAAMAIVGVSQVQSYNDTRFVATRHQQPLGGSTATAVVSATTLNITLQHAGRMSLAADGRTHSYPDGSLHGEEEVGWLAIAAGYRGLISGGLALEAGYASFAVSDLGFGEKDRNSPGRIPFFCTFRRLHRDESFQRCNRDANEQMKAFSRRHNIHSFVQGWSSPPRSAPLPPHFSQQWRPSQDQTLRSLGSCPPIARRYR